MPHQFSHFRQLLYTSCILLFITTFGSCTGIHSGMDFKYAVIVYDSVQNTSKLITTNSLTSDMGRVSEVKIDIPGYILAAYNKRYFVMDAERRQFRSYLITSTGLLREHTLDLKSTPWEPYMSWVNFVNAHTILIGTVNKGKFSYLEVELDQMRILRQGNLEVPAPGNPASNYVGVSGQFHDDKLFVNYTFQNGMMREHIVPCSDTTYLAQFSYPELRLEHTSKDNRTTWLGTYCILAPNSLTFRNNVYVLGQPGGRTGNQTSAPSAVLKLDTAGKGFDPSYYFEIGDEVHEEAYTLHDLGHGMALTSVVPAERIHRFRNYMVDRVANYFLLDLEKKKKIKLDLPDVHLDWIMNVIHEGDNAYFSVYQNDGNSQIWQYHHPTAELKKVIHLSGAISRIDHFPKEM